MQIKHKLTIIGTILAAAAVLSLLIAAVKPVPADTFIAPMKDILLAPISASAHLLKAASFTIPEISVEIKADGETYSISTYGTVENALTEAGVAIDENDLINVPLNESLIPKMQIHVNRVETRHKTVLTELNFATQTIEDDTLFIGETEIIEEGEQGLDAKTYEHTYIDGVLKSTELVDSDVAEPQDRVVAVGTKPVHRNVPEAEKMKSTLPVPEWLSFDENGVPTEYKKVHTGKGVAYYAHPESLTASGRTVRPGHVAVDPDLIPYGTELFITSTDGKHIYGYAIAADTGGSMLSGDCLVDLFMYTYDECVQWGAHQVNVYVLR
ncbi:MAG: G5 domain-containing protein [Ruminococcus sp.]|nr:G5 domain-containing protein [Ruminococcus sp.]